MHVCLYICNICKQLKTLWYQLMTDSEKQSKAICWRSSSCFAKVASHIRILFGWPSGSQHGILAFKHMHTSCSWIISDFCWSFLPKSPRGRGLEIRYVLHGPKSRNLPWEPSWELHISTNLNDIRSMGLTSQSQHISTGFDISRNLSWKSLAQVQFCGTKFLYV